MRDIVGWLPAAVALIMLLGAAAVYLRGARDKGTIEVLQRNNEALTDWRATLEVRVQELEARVKALVIENAALREKATILESIANSSEAIAELRAAVLADIDDHHTQVMDTFSELSPVLDHIDHTLGDILDAMGGNES